MLQDPTISCHTRRSFRLIIGCLLLCGLGCSGPRPPAQEQVSALRILAIQATPPMVRPGTKITLRALVASPWIQPVTYRWYACASQADSNRGCADKDDAIDLGSGDTATYTVPATYLPKNPSALDAFRGRYLPITLVAKAGPHQEVASKRVVVTLLQGNKNPTIEDMELRQGDQKAALQAPWQVSAGAQCTLTPTVAKDARQDYITVDTNGKLHQVQEELFFSWYITGGSLSGGRTSNHENSAKTWTTPQDLPNETKGRAFIYMILRDGRGGVDWRSYQLQLR